MTSPPDLLHDATVLRPSLNWVQHVAMGMVLFALAACVFGLFGFNGRFYRDDGNFVYTGQQMAEGVPPYVSLYDHNGPLVPMISGWCVMLSKWIGRNDLYTTRVIFYLFGCLSVVAIYGLGLSLFRSARDGFFAGLVFLSFGGFSRHVASGPRKQVPMMLVEILSLWLTSRKQWFWSGVCGSLCFLIWQPILVMVMATLLIAAVQPAGHRLRAIASTLLGLALPMVAVGGYFYSHDALYDLWDGTILFNLQYLDRGSRTLFDHFWDPVQSLYMGFASSLIPIVLGLAAMFYAYPWRRSLHPSWIETIRQDPFAPLLLTFPAPVIWSFLDWQHYPDFWVLIPYVTIGFAALVAWMLDHAGSKSPGMSSGHAQRGLTVMVAIGILAIAVGNVRYRREKELIQEVADAREIVRKYGDDVHIVSLSAPNLMVLLHRTNLNRYLFLDGGIDLKIDATTDRGFNGWLQEILAAKPDIIAFDRIYPFCENRHNLMAWLRRNFEEHKIGNWVIWVRNGLKPVSKAGRAPG